ncbi:Pentatricopeptide repeat-containing protein [Apostasia shenzhenica]|uniref:Pentatricopeptide repeat-containing protein n=1 Tax=Apostasia shenzhenica TaxID=1088818 RepID=A0A2I0AC01_9ASPA|nr:Pentatricopeptide repeat-containing protein [Apostasia shenzhenica]
MLFLKERRRIPSNGHNRSIYQFCTIQRRNRDDPGPSSSSSWTRAIRTFAELRRYRRVLSLYAQMNQAGHHPDPFSISAALKACARLRSLAAAAAIHGQIHKLGYLADVYAQTALVGLYAKIDSAEIAWKVFDEMPKRNVVSWNSILSAHLRTADVLAARRVFDEMPVKDVVSWNSMASGYARAGDMERATELFQAMPERNSASWNGMISAWIERGDMDSARKLFDEMPVRSNVSWIAMISGYSQSGDVSSAEELFEMMEAKDLFTWNAMIACYTQNGFPKEAIQLFNRMQKSDAECLPDEMTLSSVISACSQLGDMELGLLIKSYMSSVGIELDDHLRTAFIDLFSKCGVIDHAFELFYNLRERDLVAYSAMILGCGINGRCVEAVRLFGEMQELNIAPNSVTFTGLLTAYNHAGLVNEGRKCFASMSIEHHLPPSIDHYAIMVDLLGRKGRLGEAYQLIKGMQLDPHVGVWGALLYACRLHGNVELGEIAANKCFELEPEAAGYYVILANIYAESGQHEKAKNLRKVMVERGLTKVPGCSWAEPE